MAQRVPLTTSSDEAHTHFEEARRLAGATHWDAAAARLDQAIEADSEFALAYAWRAYVSRPADRQRFLDEARARAGRASDGERLWIEAWTANHSGNRDRELELLEQAALLYPEDPHLLYWIGTLHRGRRNYDRATEALDRAVRAAPDFTPALNMRGYVAKEQGDYETAERVFREYARLAPEDPNAHDSLGELYLKQGRSREARERFEEAVRVDPSFVYALQNVGNAHLLAGRYDAARRTYREAMQRYDEPGDKAWMQARIAESYVYEGDHDRARPELDRLLEMARAATPGWQVQAHSRRVLFFLEEGDLAGAERSARAILEIARSEALPEGHRRQHELLATLYLGLLDARRGDHAAARDKAEAFARGHEELGSAMAPQRRALAHGLLALERRDFAEAARLLAQADAANPYVLYRLGVAHAALGDTEAARDYFYRAAEHNEPYTFSYEMEHALTRPQARQAAAAGGHPGSVPMLDPLRMAPEHYAMLGEDEALRVVEIRIPPGQSDRTHAHPHEAVYFVKGSTVRLHLPSGETPEMEIPDGHVLVHGPWAHRVENIGASELHAVAVERKPADAAEAWRGIGAASREFEAAFNRQDAAGMAALYTDDGQVLPTGAGVVAGKPAVQAFWQGVFDAGLTRAELETTEVFPAGDEAAEVGRYALWAGDALADAGKYVVVWRRTEGGWKLHRDIFNTSRSPDAVAQN
jgi:tetratricopeptide (TPR) repeat protein